MTRRNAVASIDLSSKSRLVISVAADQLDLRLHSDINGCGVFLATGEGVAIPRAYLGELICALEDIECDVCTSQD